jgi:hypothetical protein
MKKLIKIEWMKVKDYRTFWVLSILYLISIFGANLIAFRIQQSIFEQEKTKIVAGLFIGNTPYSFPSNWQMTSWLSSFLMFVPGLLVLISICNEFSYKTHRQNIIDGWSRSQFITAKFLFLFIITIISTVVVFIAALLFGFADGHTSFSLNDCQYIGYFFIQCLSYSSAALLIGVLLKRSGIAIGVYFLYATILENSIAGILNRYVNNIGRFLPLESTDNLIPMPFFKSMQRQFLPETSAALLLGISVFYLLAYYVVVKKRFETSDL